MAQFGIGETIAAALQHEATSQQLRRRIEEQLPRLRDKLVLPQCQPVEALMAFITSYVQSVPGCLRLVRAISKRLGFFDYAAPFLRMAEDYFIQPPSELPNCGGLESLLDEAFLAHRLLEEVNDHHIRHLQRPLLPVDMTEANIIVHHLLGDEFASQLEQLVQFTASQLLRQEHVWQHAQALTGTGNWPLVSPHRFSERAQEVRLKLAS
ncbi:MAG: hypothetical protein AAGA91_03510 [Pseudomonadota bacterium]